MERFIKKHITKNSDNINRLYVGYEKTSCKRNDFYIDISEHPCRESK